MQTHMKHIETKWALGNFSVTLTHEPQSQEALETLAALGLRFLGQRNSAVDKILGGFRAGKDGKQERIAGWKRTDVAFDGKLADALAESFSRLALPDSELTLAASAKVEEYQRESAERVYKDARAKLAARESKAGFEEWCVSALGYTGETHGTDGEFALELVKALDAKLKAAAKAAMDAIA